VTRSGEHKPRGDVHLRPQAKPPEDREEKCYLCHKAHLESTVKALFQRASSNNRVTVHCGSFFRSFMSFPASLASSTSYIRFPQIRSVSLSPFRLTDVKPAPLSLPHCPTDANAESRYLHSCLSLYRRSYVISVQCLHAQACITQAINYLRLRLYYRHHLCDAFSYISARCSSNENSLCPALAVL
jgi:hypothetical protein